MAFTRLPEGVSRGYGTVKPQAKVLPFPKGTFFCESKDIIPYIDKLSHTALSVRLILASIAHNKDGFRIAKMHPEKIAQKSGWKKAAVYKAIRELKDKKFLLGSKGNWMLIEPTRESFEAPEKASKENPGQLYLFEHLTPKTGEADGIRT
jgi:hypothetical protein